MNARRRSLVLLAATLAPGWVGCGTGDDSSASVPVMSDGGATTDGSSKSDATVADASASGDAAMAASSAGDATTNDATAADGAMGSGATGAGGAAMADGGAPSDAGANASGDVATDAPMDGANSLAITTFAGVRVANWSSDSPAIDFCLAPHGSGTFQGPIMTTAQQQADGGLGELPFGMVSAYSLVPPGQSYDVRIVLPGGDCSAALLVSDAKTATLPMGGTTTVGLIGSAAAAADSGVALKLLVMPDEFKSPAPIATDAGLVGQFKTRFVHAAAGLQNVDFRASPEAIAATDDFSGGDFWMFLGAAYGSFGSTDGGTGYKLLKAGSPFDTATIVNSGGDSGVIPPSQITTAGGGVFTVVLAGTASPGIPPTLFECVDNGATATLYSNCRPSPTAPTM